MSRLRKRRSEEDTDINMVPIMNMFLVLIPFLLMSASFFQLRVINTSVPVLANSAASENETPETNIKITAVLEVKKTGVDLSAISDEVSPEELNKMGSYFKLERDGRYPIEQMVLSLKTIKDKFPKSDTLILIPEETVKYDTIILVMDATRHINKELLFPNVVLSGKV